MHLPLTRASPFPIALMSVTPSTCARPSLLVKEVLDQGWRAVRFKVHWPSVFLTIIIDSNSVYLSIDPFPIPGVL